VQLHRQESRRAQFRPAAVEEFDTRDEAIYSADERIQSAGLLFSLEEDALLSDVALLSDELEAAVEPLLPLLPESLEVLGLSAVSDLLLPDRA